MAYFINFQRSFLTTKIFFVLFLENAYLLVPNVGKGNFLACRDRPPVYWGHKVSVHKEDNGDMKWEKIVKNLKSTVLGVFQNEIAIIWWEKDSFETQLLEIYSIETGETLISTKVTTRYNFFLLTIKSYSNTTWDQFYEFHYHNLTLKWCSSVPDLFAVCCMQIMLLILWACNCW